MKSIFVCARAFIALNEKQDPNHADAVNFVTGLFNETVKVYTSLYEVVDAAEVIHRKSGLKKAARFLQIVRGESGIVVLAPGSVGVEEVVKIYLKKKRGGVYPKQALVVSMMRQHGIKDLFTFDQHLADYNFMIWPRK